MLSSRGTKVVRLQRKKSGLDFSIKGGKEHGIPIIVSWIKVGGAAASHLRLGDEILAVNGNSLSALSHSQAVHQLKDAGSTVVLRVKPNQTLEDVFSATLSSQDASLLESMSGKQSEYLDQLQTPPAMPLSELIPAGWGQKVDHKTGKTYFENHYTQTTTWTDPQTMAPVPLGQFKWNELPPGWERFLDTQGDMYYVNYDTQTTHWDSPRGKRQQKQLKELNTFLKSEREKLKAEEDKLKSKRELLLQKNNQLDTLEPVTPLEDDLHEGDSPLDLYDDLMLLNEEVEAQDVHVSIIRNHLKKLSDILRHAQNEDMGGLNEYDTAAGLAVALVAQFAKVKVLEGKLHSLVGSIRELQKSQDSNATPLTYMLQLPPSKSPSEIEEETKWLHVLPDRLTGKTNCEMRVELCLLQECFTYGESLHLKLTSFYSQVMRSHGGWEQLMASLAGCDFSPLNDHWLRSEFREKLKKLCSF